MRFQTIASALALSGSALAFSDSSPWVLLSTSKMPKASSYDQMQASSGVIKYTKDVLSQCATDRYLLVTQPGVNAADLKLKGECTMPSLCKAVDDSRVKGKYTVAEVVGDVAGAGFADQIRSACSKKSKEVVVEEIQLESLSADGRVEALAQNDATLARTLDTTTKGRSYTILFYASPQEPMYEPDFADPVHMNTKRDGNMAGLRKSKNETEIDRRPLFEKYQFFTPGIFMGIIATVVLLSILYAGISGLASLEVSYGAFEKDMGPAAQKKQQ